MRQAPPRNSPGARLIMFVGPTLPTVVGCQVEVQPAWSIVRLRFVRFVGVHVDGDSARVWMLTRTRTMVRRIRLGRLQDGPAARDTRTKPFGSVGRDGASAGEATPDLLRSLDQSSSLGRVTALPLSAGAGLLG
jgi:hypothetical protein